MPYKNIHLNNILHVPHSTKNLLSIAKLAQDNNVIAKFNSDIVFVKDQATKKVLLQGAFKNGLYSVLLPVFNKSIFSSFDVTSRTFPMLCFNS